MKSTSDRNGRVRWRRRRAAARTSPLPPTVAGRFDPLHRHARWIPGGAPCAAADTADALNPAANANALPVDLISDEEMVILLLKPSSLYIVLSSLGVIFAASFIGLLLALLCERLQSLGFSWTERDAVAFAAVIIGARLLWQTVDWFNQVYVLTDRRVIAVSGVIKRRVFESPLRNIHHLAIIASWRERLFGLGTIVFATTGSHTYEAAWLMVSKPVTVHRKVLQTIDRYGRNHPT